MLWRETLAGTDRADIVRPKYVTFFDFVDNVQRPAAHKDGDLGYLQPVGRSSERARHYTRVADHFLQFRGCCQTNENSHQIVGMAFIYALNNWRHSARAAARFRSKNPPHISLETQGGLGRLTSNACHKWIISPAPSPSPSPPPQSLASGHQISPRSTTRKSAYWRTLPSDAPPDLR